jgi:hypothetical protein
MKKIIALLIFISLTVSISNFAIAGFFGGGPNLGKMKRIQEEAYQAGKSCMRAETLHACSDFIKSYKKQSDLLIDNLDYFKRNSDNPDCQQIILNGNNLQRLAEVILASQKK